MNLYHRFKAHLQLEIHLEPDILLKILSSWANAVSGLVSRDCPLLLGLRHSLVKAHILSHPEDAITRGC